ncbi:MAG: molybdopterin converting factor subunit 1 [Proteobacteria bacterium]|nr:molybdopterin converting factor subunit 1 [Pseudomonadota bacterium]
MQVLYFAWLRERIGLAEERVEPPQEVASVADLVGWLRSRGAGYAEALADPGRVRCAINQEFATLGAALAHGDEVAFFPPITGG